MARTDRTDRARARAEEQRRLEASTARWRAAVAAAVAGAPALDLGPPSEEALDRLLVAAAAAWGAR